MLKRFKFILFICTLMVPVTGFAHQFTWENLLLARWKLDQNVVLEDHVDSYMQQYRSAVWQRYRNDEFELEDKRKETLKIMEARVSDFDLAKPFIINTSFEFGDYDFNKSMFPLNALQPTSYYQETNWSHGTMPRNLRVTFSNTEIIGNLMMEKDDAKTFIHSRKDRFGGVNRKVPAEVAAVVQKVDSNGYLIAQIMSVTVFEDSSRSKVLAAFQ